MTSLMFEVISPRLLIALYGTSSPTNARWAQYLRALDEMGDDIRVLAFSAGGGPSLMQRKQL